MGYTLIAGTRRSLTWEDKFILMGPGFGFCVKGPMFVATFLAAEDAVARFTLSFAAGEGGGPPPLAGPVPPPLLLMDMLNFFFSAGPLLSPVGSTSKCGRLTWNPVSFVWNTAHNVACCSSASDGQ